jgi:hypothetical protein
MAYPVRVEVDYHEEQDRLFTFLRILLLIPAFVVLYFVQIAAGVVTLIAWFAILFTGRFPQGMHEFVGRALRWQTRVTACAMLLTDKYPPFNGDDDLAYPIRVQVDYQEQHNRLTTFFRYFLVLPAAIVAGLVGFVANLVVFAAWFVIVFTGKFPKGMHDFVGQALRWQTRVNAYGMLLTDVYPPFNGDA